MNQRGVTLIESLVGVGMLVIVIFASLMVFRNVVVNQVQSEKSVDMIVARNRLISQILDQKTWNQTAVSTENQTLFNCMINLNQVTSSQRNCFGISGSPNLYALNGDLVAELQNPNLGISTKGIWCTSFQAPPAAGDPNCPIGVRVQMTAQCASSPCVNPTFLFQSAFVFNGGPDQMNLNMLNYDFSIVKAGIYSPAQPVPIDLASSSSIVVNATQVMGAPTAPEFGQYATISNVVLPHRRVFINFILNPNFYDLTFANNRLRICLLDEETSACLFTFEHRPQGAGFAYELFQNGASVFNQPSWVNLTGSELYQFQIVNGLVKFCLNSRCLNVFEQKLEGPFRVRIYPPKTNGANQPVVGQFSVDTTDL